MKIGITGATGLVGSALRHAATRGGHQVVAFSRRPVNLPDAEVRVLSSRTLPDITGLDAIVNLAGESIFGLWTQGKKRRIRMSRVEGTRRIVEAISQSSDRPAVLLNGSAVGYYGDTHDTLADEKSPAGSGFLAEVCKDWEEEALKAEALGVRVACLRTGIVLSRIGGAMGLIRPVFHFCLGGNLGNGRQWMSCVHIDDLAGIILWILRSDDVRGPVNAVLPEPVQNRDFTKTLAKTMHRPAIFPAPAIMMKLVLGEMSHMLLDSSRVRPATALEGGYSFKFATLADALGQAVD